MPPNETRPVRLCCSINCRVENYAALDSKLRKCTVRMRPSKSYKLGNSRIPVFQSVFKICCSQHDIIDMIMIVGTLWVG